MATVEKNALLPTELLSIFLESEAGRFVAQFRTATRGMEADLADTKQKIIAELLGMVQSLDSMHENIKSVLYEVSGVVGAVEEVEVSVNKSLKNILGSAEGAEGSATNAMDAIKDILESLGHIEEGMAESYKKITASLSYLQIQEQEGSHKRLRRFWSIYILMTQLSKPNGKW